MSLSAVLLCVARGKSDRCAGVVEAKVGIGSEVQGNGDVVESPSVKCVPVVGGSRCIVTVPAATTTWPGGVGAGGALTLRRVGCKSSVSKSSCPHNSTLESTRWLSPTCAATVASLAHPEHTHTEQQRRHA